MTTGIPALEVRGLGVAYGHYSALCGVSFSAGRGELIAVIGPNGAGKSSLFRAICGLVPATGSVAFGGAAAERSPAVAYLPQRADIDTGFPITVGQMVLAGRRRRLAPWRRPRHVDRASIRDALARVDLSHRADDPIGTLSGGQLQRAFVARALAQEAEVLLFDEALSGVDPAHALDLMVLLEELADDGRTILVSTHDLAVARRRFGRCLAINGRVVADGAPEDVLDPLVLEATFGSGHLLPIPLDHVA